MRQELTANEVQYRKTLAEERDRSAALASELATAQRNVECQLVRSNKTAKEATELKKAADTAASELQRERERAEALTSELAKVRREVEAAAAVSSQKDDEAVQLKKAETGVGAAELQQSLQKERQRANRARDPLSGMLANLGEILGGPGIDGLLIGGVGAARLLDRNSRQCSRNRSRRHFGARGTNIGPENCGWYRNHAIGERRHETHCIGWFHVLLAMTAPASARFGMRRLPRETTLQFKSRSDMGTVTDINGPP